MDIDLQTLLAPLSGDDPCGEDVSFDTLFDQIREARRADDPHLDQGEWQTELKAADWRLAEDLASQVLREQSKDLQAAVWLSEAWIYRYGLPGATQAFSLLHRLLETYWPRLYPQLEGEDSEERAGKLAWFNTYGTAALRQLLLAGTGTSLNDWQSSRDMDNLARQNRDAYEAALDDGKPTGEIFDAALAAGGGAHIRAQLEATLSAQAAFDALQAKIDELFGRDAPSLASLADTLKRLEQVLGKCAQTLGIGPASSTQETTAEIQTSQATPNIPAIAAPTSVGFNPNLQASSQTVKADALKALNDIAIFFKRSEPHSPVAYLLERAVAWADMPLEEWLKEVVQDDSVLLGIRDRIGLPRQEY